MSDWAISTTNVSSKLSACLANIPPLVTTTKCHGSLCILVPSTMVRVCPPTIIVSSVGIASLTDMCQRLEARGSHL